MTPQSLSAILRTLADAHAPASDADLLRAFLADDEAAFAELVKRHGRLVWAVCRNLTGSDADADDAFQATFLVLLKNAKKVRDAGKLSSWLHGVAYKVCGKTRLGAKRRTTREKVTAHREGNGTVVPESAWDRALAAVHEEAAKLPETLRVPFVLCCLEGKGVTEAAEQLGWKLGTLSGRLTRAKDAVLAKLDARGLTLGVVAAVGLALPPATALAKASALAHVGSVIPGSILQLTQGVIGMSMTTVKVMAATVLLTCGLGLSVGTGWVATADAQQPAKVKPKTTLDDDVKNLTDALKRTQAELAAQQAKQAAEAERVARDAAARARQVADKKRAEDEANGTGVHRLTFLYHGLSSSFRTAKWEYDLVPLSPMDNAADVFPRFLQEKETAGWEFLGSTTGGPSGDLHQWLFRRPVKAASSMYIDLDGRDQVGGITSSTPVKPVAFDFAIIATSDDPKMIAAEIDRLTAKLAELKAKKPAVNKLTIQKDVLPVPAADLANLLRKLAEKKFGPGKVGISSSENGVAVEGAKDAIEWATGIVKALGGK